ncbi:MAG: hypothetical protein WBZ37_29010 [Mycobacterium sp.]
MTDPADLPLLPTPSVEDADDEGELAKFIVALHTEQDRGGEFESHRGHSSCGGMSARMP